jgi:hypothetical protein
MLPDSRKRSANVQLVRIAALSMVMVGGCGGGGTETPLAPAARAGSVAVPAAGGQALRFSKDGASVAVDFSRWGTPAYYQKGGNTVSRLVVTASEVLGAAGRFVSLDLTARDETVIGPGSYDCAKAAGDGVPVVGTITYAEDSMARVWKSVPPAACRITITEIGPVGGRLRGTFSATLPARKGTDTAVTISDGVFDVERDDYGAETR